MTMNGIKYNGNLNYNILEQAIDNEDDTIIQKSSKIFDYVIISIDIATGNDLELNQTKANIIKDILYIFYNRINQYDADITPNQIFFVIPEHHVNAPVGKNISFNLIRKHPDLFNNTVWIGADDDDEIKFDNMLLTRNFILNSNFNTDNILLNQENQAFRPIRNSKYLSVKRYASWSYFFSPLYYNNISYRTLPMNKEDLDFSIVYVLI